MKKLILIDGNAIMHRAYHALPKSLTTRSREPINAVYGFVSMLLRIIQDLKPTHIAVAFDRKEPTFRRKEFKDYQAHRPEMDEELDTQFDKAKETLEAFGIPTFEKVGFEADDVLGSIAKKSQSSKPKAQKEKINEVVIVTGDRDILQLVDDKRKVRVYLPIKGLSEGKVFKEEDVLEKLGVTPSQIVDYKALVGDPSDNYKGVPGIGPKTAESLLRKHKSLGDIYENLDRLDEATRKKLSENKDSALQSQMLAKIVTDVSLDVNFDGMSNWSVGNEKTLQLFREFGFRTLTRRVIELGAALDKKRQTSLF